jgi:hypothetical protein
MIRAVAANRLRAKIRTGGVSADAFPDAAQVARFIRACYGAGVAFKATAGLHHPLRGIFPLTYEPQGPRGTMFGFLNVFVGSLLLEASLLAEAQLCRLLEDGEAGHFHFTAHGLSWQNAELSWAEVAPMRRRFALSYGSCSFVEPLEDLQRLNLL